MTFEADSLRQNGGGEIRAVSVQSRYSSQYKNTYFTEMCSGSKAGLFQGSQTFESLTSRLEGHNKEDKGSGGSVNPIQILRVAIVKTKWPECTTSQVV